MLDVFRQRLSKEELEKYDLYDSRASLFSFFVVWPGIAGLVSYAFDRAHLTAVCLVIVAVAFPGLIFFARRARGMREIAEKRYVALVDSEAAREMEEKRSASQGTAAKTSESG